MTSTLPTGNSINLQLGWPSPSLFPSADLETGAHAVLSNFDVASGALIYGPNRGYIPLRQQIARWLGSVYHNDAEAIEEGRVCVAGGASQNLANVLSRFTDPTYTRRIWMVEPTYFLACPIFEDAGYVGKLRGVPEDEEGIDLKFLRAALAETEAEVEREGGSDSPKLKKAANGYEKIFKHIIYVVPTFSNPSGKTMSLQHRYDLVKLAIEYDALIVSDDVYDFLYWPQEREAVLDRSKIRPPPRLVDINRELDPTSKWGNTVSNGSFSKIIAPGVRVSWAQGTPAFATFLANTGGTASGGNPGHVVSTFISQMFSSGSLERHIHEVLIPTYRARYYTMIDAIQQHLVPLGITIDTGRPYFSSPSSSPSSTTPATNGTAIQLAGGFFLLLTLPQTSTLAPTPTLAKLALEQHSLKFAYGKMFEVKGDEGSRQRSGQTGGFGDSIRLCWAFHDEKTIVEGIERLRDVLVENGLGAR